ncbi:DUF3386 domain-containing protein [Prochlorococcus sp. MIT 1300]|uniref:DUF3386 domain-containing protein n=1 Tax=Prochlorococcus sp. MIT 1300 TaxID=3096218 RepID=UPI002A74F175|nr:DUF3386 domain-containing protein [Prochlorococcus sp. MIT 1300]
MVSPVSNPIPVPGTDCSKEFKAAYENRYTWDPDFSGYLGRCVWETDARSIEGCFKLNSDLKAEVFDIDDEKVHKSISSQLWEVAIHRVRRSFAKIHGENTFTAGDVNHIGMEVIVGGKNTGDKYRIKDNVVTMVNRHIHGQLITINTKSVTNTMKGYLSKEYTSQYSDPIKGEPIRGLSKFKDIFVPLYNNGPWVLTERSVQTESFGNEANSFECFKFLDLKAQ